HTRNGWECRCSDSS
ncbi:matrix protein 2, partial [Influenza A virus (A/northern pintail/Alaska/44183-072/2006(H3N8))]